MRPIKVLPLGVSGAGKSVYLASLYDRLAVKNSDTCFRLETSEEVSIKLSSIYASIKDARKPWPAGTRGGEYGDFNFDCIVDARDGSYCVMKLAYLDFPGGLLTGDLENSKFHSRFKETDAFLVLLDGSKILSALEGDHSVTRSIDDDLSALLNPLQQHIRKPLHFVVTKWDLLEDKHELQAVANFLNGFDRFRAVVDTRMSLGRTTRLIPVSAVGSRFCKIGPDGVMQKLENIRAKPFNVDLPVSCLMFDLIDDMQKNIKEELDKSFFRRLWFRVVGNGSLLLSVSKAAIEMVPMPPGIAFIKTFLQMGVMELFSAVEKSREKMREQYGSTIVDAKSAQQAFSVLAQYHAMEIHWLKRQYPASNLSPR